MSKEMIYGRRSVLETLRAGRREFFELYLLDTAKQPPIVQSIISHSHSRGIPTKTVSKHWLNDRLRSANHQGVALSVSDFPFSDVADLVEMVRNGKGSTLILLLDQIQDPQNAGTLLRTAEIVGATGVVMQTRRSAPISPSVVRSSAGATEHLTIVSAPNLVQVMRQLKQEGVWIYGLEAGGASIFGNKSLTGPLGLVVGAEGSGLRKLVKETCDGIVSIPMKGNIESLNAAVAGSIALYEVLRLREFAS